MVQISILSGHTAGDVQVVRRFPFSIGRAADNDLCLDAEGIWNYHCMVEFQRDEGFNFQTFEEAFATVNDQPQKCVRLRHGDVVSIGAVKLQFWLAAPHQRGLRVRELFVWLLLVFVTLGQCVLIYWLLGVK